jgi:hypothetical protein
MGRYLTLCLVVLSAAAHADVCYKLEYAELDSLPREELLQIHCQYRDDMQKFAASGSTANMNLANKCAEELNRSERILARKYGLKSTGDARIREVNAMCSRH